jgi:hypothetical protein
MKIGFAVFLFFPKLVLSLGLYLAARRSKKKALITVAHKMIIILYHMLSNKVKYREDAIAA